MNEKRHLIISDTYEESDYDNKHRWRSIKLMYLLSFLGTMQFSIVVTSMWPYTLLITPTEDTTMLGWMIAMFGLGQLISSPVLGAISNYVPVNVPITFTLVLSVFGNILYIYAGAFPSHNTEVIMVARFCLGLSGGSLAVGRSYISGATTLSERTGALALSSAAYMLGLVAGPAFQAAFTPIGEKGLYLKGIALRLNMYNSTACFSALLAVICIILQLTVFKPYRVPDTGDQMSIDDGENVTIDYIGVVVALCAQFIFIHVSTAIETLLPPVGMAMYSWTRAECTLYVGIIFSVGSFLCVGVAVASGPLTKRFEERKLLILGNVVLMVSFLALIPIPGTSDYPPTPESPSPIIWSSNGTNYTNASYVTDCEDDGACGCTYDWCESTNLIYLPQLLVVIVFAFPGYAIVNVLGISIYSKLLGPKPQGVFMGILQSVVSLGMLIGPIHSGYFFNAFGPTWTFLTIGAMLFAILMAIILAYDRLKPYIQNKQALELEKHEPLK